MNPWPGAFTYIPDREAVPRKLKLFEAAQNPRLPAPPGMVIGAGPRGILVGCGIGALLLRDVQLEGKRRMPAREFLKGHPIPRGTMLGLAP